MDDDLDLYAYTGDDPVDHGDPTGLEAGGFSNGDMSGGVTGDFSDQWHDHPGLVVASTAVFAAPAVVGCAAAPEACGAAARALMPKVSIGAGTGGIVNGVVAAIEGKPIVPAVVNGAASGAATAAAGVVTPGRGTKAAVVGLTSAAAAKATGGSNFEAGLAGAVSGSVEYATGNEKLANGAALGFEGFVGDVVKSLTKKTASSIVKEPMKGGCQAINNGHKC